MNLRVISFAFLTAAPFLLQTPAMGAEPVTVEFLAPGGVKEKCVAGIRLPGGRYFPADTEQEKKFCSIDFHTAAVALCPKLWSTSPATVVYDVRSGRFPNDAAKFESQSCGKGGSARADAATELALYKMSVNSASSSGTFAPSSLVYYHLSRYFHTEVQVPVSVYRTVDKGEHRRRVVEPGLKYTAGKSNLRMLRAGWQYLHDATNPSSALQPEEIFTEDRKQLFGILIYTGGDRYGPIVNGTRAGGWGAGQVRSMQRTPAFHALRQPKDLADAIREGLRQARRDPAMDKVLGLAPSDPQMVFWMRELSEIALLDYILGQQDRVGNIDYFSHWYWVKEGILQNQKASGRKVPPQLTALSPALLKRTWLNDNDAGVRPSYSDLARETGMLDGFAHFSLTTYRQLITLHRDLQSKGELHRHLSTFFALDAKELHLIVERTKEAADMLQRACREKRLRFDLEPEEFFVKGSVQHVAVDCDRP